MQVIKLDSLINNKEPMKVATPLGIPTFKLNPVTLTFSSIVGDTFDEFTTDGRLPSDNMLFTKGVSERELGVFVKDSEGYGLRLKDRYLNSHNLATDTDITVLLTFKDNDDVTSRVFMVGHSENQIMISGNSGNYSAHYPTGEAQSPGLPLSSAIESLKVNKIAILVREGLTTFIVNGIEFSAVSQRLFGSSTPVTLNGRRSIASNSADTTYYDFQIYEGGNITKEQVLAYYF